MSLDEDWVIAPTAKQCTRCGDCCRALPCALGDVSRAGVCKYLHGNSCVLAEKSKKYREQLLVGYGCGATFIPKPFVEKKRVP